MGAAPRVRAILDTSVLIGGIRTPSADEFAISAISLAELHFGVLVARSTATRSARLRRLSGIERAFEALPVDGAVARAYGSLATAVVDAGRQPRRRSFDLVIAATAMVHEVALHTYNPDDLAGLEAMVEVVGLENSA